jgi:NitT/TauT family transport system permease protein
MIVPKKEYIIKYFFPPFISIIFVLILWQSIVVAFRIPSWKFPGPLVISKAIITEFDIIRPQIIITYSNVIVGLLFSVVLGVSLASVINFYRSVGIVLAPFINLLCIIPVITIVPLLMLWVGFDNKVKLIVIIMQSFPIINLNTATAFANIDPVKPELMRSMQASKFKVLRFCLLPASITGIFTGIKIASIFAMLAEITSEITGGDEGLGSQIIKYSSYMKIPETFACIFFVAIFGSIFYQLICIIERKITRNSVV